MSDTPLLLAFPHEYDVAHERTVRGSLREVVYYPGARRDGGSDGAWLRIVPRERPPWTGVFATELVDGRLSRGRQLAGPARALRRAGQRAVPRGHPRPRPLGAARRARRRAGCCRCRRGLALLLGDDVLAAYDAAGAGLGERPARSPARSVAGPARRRGAPAGRRAAAPRSTCRHGRTTTEDRVRGDRLARMRWWHVAPRSPWRRRCSARSPGRRATSGPSSARSTPGGTSSRGDGERLAGTPGCATTRTRRGCRRWRWRRPRRAGARRAAAGGAARGGRRRGSGWCRWRCAPTTRRRSGCTRGTASSAPACAAATTSPAAPTPGCSPARS